MGAWHVVQYTTDSGVTEDYIDILGFVLTEIGGFVRYSELNREQRASMMTQERANMLMQDMTNRVHDTTDSSSSSSSSPSSSSSSAMPRPTKETSSTTDADTAP